VIIDLTPVGDGIGPARLLDMVDGRSKQAQSSTAEHVDRCRLLGDQRSLPQGQDQHGRHQFDTVGDSCEEAEENERLVERFLVREVLPSLRPVHGAAAEDVLGGQDPVIAHLLDPLRVCADGAWIVADLVLGKEDSDTHRRSSSPR
jgi:hypothetical protein